MKAPCKIQDVKCHRAFSITLLPLQFFIYSSHQPFERSLIIITIIIIRHDSKSWRGCVTCPWSHSWCGVESGFKPKTLL